MFIKTNCLSKAGGWLFKLCPELNHFILGLDLLTGMLNIKSNKRYRPPAALTDAAQRAFKFDSNTKQTTARINSCVQLVL